MFKNIKNRMWLMGLAKHELYSSLMRTDPVAVKSVASQFEEEMRAKGSWPFDSPEVMSLYFSTWFGKLDKRYWR